MQFKSTIKAILAAILSLVMAATGCTAHWISVALADLPVLTQMALNITSLVVTLRTARQISPEDAAAIQNFSAKLSQDLNLLQSLYNQYKANPEASTLQMIQSTIEDINQNLPGSLAALHIADPAVSARIIAGVNLILTTVQSFAVLLPPTARTARRIPGQIMAVPSADDLKAQWNQQVCSPTGTSGFDSALAGCVLR